MKIMIRLPIASLPFVTMLLVVLAAGVINSTAQTPCPLAGAYRIDVDSSDKLYSVVRGATSKVPFGDQQRFFMDLSTRLTPPPKATGKPPWHFSVKRKQNAGSATCFYGCVLNSQICARGDTITKKQDCSPRRRCRSQLPIEEKHRLSGARWLRHAERRLCLQAETR